MAGQPRGRCAFCRHETTKSAMGKHLGTCAARQQRIAASKSRKPQSLIHLRMQDEYSPTFWLDVEVDGTAPLSDIDSYLRAIWLECCGHLSKFTTGGWGSSELAKPRRVDSVFKDGAELIHIYDFGTESITRIKAMGSRQAEPLTRRPIVLMARNLIPEAQCIECDQPASHLCQECQQEWDSPGLLCKRHTQNHPHDEYGEPIELVNSPRVGLCGYTGPAEPPY